MNNQGCLNLETDTKASVALDPFAGLLPTDLSASSAANDGFSPAVQVESAQIREQGSREKNAVFEDRAEMALRSIVGPRLIKARKASGYAQQEAALANGYATPAQLSQWEMGRRFPPASELIKMARLYGVSVDYLLGENDEPERDPSAALRHACLRAVRNMMERAAELTIDQVANATKLVGPHAQHERSLLRSGEGLLEALYTVMRLNAGGLDDLRGWATVLRVMNDFEAALEDARQRIATHDRLDGDLRRSWSSIADTDLKDAGED